MPTWVIFAIVLSILVFVHELGHFLAARMLGIRVEEFAFGLPFTPPILKFTRGGTQYAVYPLIFGGFVRLYGEESEVRGERGEDFFSRGKKQRMVVVAAGVVMNFVLAFAGFAGLYAVVGVPLSNINKVTVVAVSPDSPAQKAGLRVDDRVIRVEDKQVGDTEEFSRLMRSWAGVGVNLVVERGTGTPLFEGIVEKQIETTQVYVVPRADPPEGEGPLGVAIANYPYLVMQTCSADLAACVKGVTAQGVEVTGLWVARVFEGLRQIGRSLVAGQVPEGVAGPIGIYQLTDVVAKGGLLPLIELTAILSVNLAVFNILPIPALDGGRMLFIWLEWVRRKRLPPSFEQKVNQWGMAVLLALLGLITLQDLWRVSLGK